MTSVIQFLQSAAVDARFARLGIDVQLESFGNLDADADLKGALMSADSSALGRLLNARAEMICMVVAPEDQPPAEESPEGDVPDGQDESPA